MEICGRNCICLCPDCCAANHLPAVSMGRSVSGYPSRDARWPSTRPLPSLHHPLPFRAPTTEPSRTTLTTSPAALQSGDSLPSSAPSFISRIPILGALVGFFASVFTLYSYSEFRKRHEENLALDAAFWARTRNVSLLAEDVVPGLSGLKGKALVPGKKYPTKPEVMAAIPKELTKKDTFKSMMYLLMSVSLTGLCVYAGTFIPYQMSYAWAWALYGMVTGTVATGCWVIGHECGHNAFSDNTFLQDTVGYLIHSTLLVPYFSWQRSHAVHHANTNHMEVGETHVPRLADDPDSKVYGWVSKIIGPLWAPIHAVIVLAIGWPMYLMRGASGGPSYGTTNHFWPFWPFNNGQKELFPGRFKLRVLFSDLGIIAAVAALVAWGKVYGPMYPLLHYVLPYLFVNAWLVGYTWLQHTDIDVPHFDQNEYTWAKGAFHTVDRPYGPLLDFLHHGIGSTHVAHHVNSAIPHYNAWEVTRRLKNTFPDLYLYDPTPIHTAVARIAQNCVAVAKQPGPDGMYVWLKDPLAAAAHPGPGAPETAALLREKQLVAV
eukprot:TRINITY_DN989_c0_g1_i1.p1 TRINITY_DN989_c0_g1~~TRINITY_DN989_c0_g1_i1.p1  ORF type:complete len:546 (-),score=152.35 TRINITY_DN989_c0_g1_i1:549-2186(-)